MLLKFSNSLWTKTKFFKQNSPQSVWSEWQSNQKLFLPFFSMYFLLINRMDYSSQELEDSTLECQPFKEFILLFRYLIKIFHKLMSNIIKFKNQ